MASIKEFKKDINFLTSEVITRCYIHMEYFCGDDKDAVYVIMQEAVDAHNEYLNRLNAKLTGKSKSEIKKHFNSIYEDLLKSTYAFLESLDKLNV